MVTNVRRAHFRKIHAIRAICTTFEKTNMYCLDNHLIVTGSPTTTIPSKHMKKVLYDDFPDAKHNKTARGSQYREVPVPQANYFEETMEP